SARGAFDCLPADVFADRHPGTARTRDHVESRRLGLRSHLAVRVHLLHGGIDDCAEEVSMKNRLRVLRAEHDLSQADLAARLGVSRQTINAIETEKYEPS